MKRIAMVVTLSILSLGTAPVAIAQMGDRGYGGWGMGMQYQQRYDPNTIETVTGEVTAVDSFMPMGGRAGGVHLRMDTSTGSVIVHLGPAWYIADQGIEIQLGDQLEITGSRITSMDEPTIVAAELRKGDQIVPLRDQNGIPVWAGWRQQR